MNKNTGESQYFFIFVGKFSIIIRLAFYLFNKGKLMGIQELRKVAGKIDFFGDRWIWGL